MGVQGDFSQFLLRYNDFKHRKIPAREAYAAGGVQYLEGELPSSHCTSFFCGRLTREACRRSINQDFLQPIILNRLVISDSPFPSGQLNWIILLSAIVTTRPELATFVRHLHFFGRSNPLHFMLNLLPNLVSLHGVKLSALPSYDGPNPRLKIKGLGLTVMGVAALIDPRARVAQLWLAVDPLALTALLLLGGVQLQPSFLDPSVPNLRDLSIDLICGADLELEDDEGLGCLQATMSRLSPSFVDRVLSSAFHFNLLLDPDAEDPHFDRFAPSSDYLPFLPTSKS